MGTQTLSAEDRSFLGLVSEAAFVNPFSERRAELDRCMAGGGRSGEGTLPAAIERVERRLAAFDQAKGGAVTIHDFRPADRAVVERTVLFAIFHRCLAALDAAIARQVDAPEEAVSVSCAARALTELRARGFEYEQAGRILALFYQIRRAYYFIDRGLVGCCPAMRRLREQLWNTIFTQDIGRYERVLWDRMEDFSILLLGPTGAGKGAAASAVGRSGFIPFNERRGVFEKSFMRTFVSVNLSQYAETLLESELFGHAKGAFTGAVAGHEGVLVRCGAHGSIFLDEIGDAGPAIQLKILKVLEERRFSPVGSHETRRFEGRVIAATNRSLDELRQEGRFRDDFYYRLCSDAITVPSLAERIAEDAGELDLMAAHTVSRILGRPDEACTRSVCEAVAAHLGADYAWPGNVRELAQCARRVLVSGEYRGDRRPRAEGPTDALAAALRGGRLTAEQLLARYCALLYERLGTYEEVARRTDLDRRTVKRYLQRLDATPAES